jgi:hypothetical protein
VLSLLEDVARTLNKRRLSLNTTADFVVFALEIQDDMLGFFSR